MSKSAYVIAGTVAAVFSGAPADHPDMQSVLVACPDTVQTGWTFDGTSWTAPVPPGAIVPASITNFQCRAILLATPNPANTAQTLFDLVDGQITAMAKTTDAYQAWEYANDVTRNGALVLQMTAALGLTSAQVDAMFIAASAISA